MRPDTGQNLRNLNEVHNDRPPAWIKSGERPGVKNGLAKSSRWAGSSSMKWAAGAPGLEMR
jgi:hypothetical protein